MDPVELFPSEIFTAIIRFAASAQLGGPLPFLAVSTIWEFTILRSPDVWTYIIINDNDDALERTETFIHLSGLQPLEIHIDPFIRDLEPLKPLLRPVVSSRMQKLHFSETPYPRRRTNRYEQRSTIIDYLRQGNNTYPMLQEMTSQWYFYPSEEFLKVCTQLRWMTGILLSSSSLTSLSNEARSIHCYLEKLGHIKQLSDRVFTSLILRDAKDHWFIDDQMDLSSLLEQCFKVIQNLTLQTNYDHHLIRYVFSQSPTGLHALSLSLPHHTLEFFASSLHFLPQLVTLRLQLSRSQHQTEWSYVISGGYKGKPSLRMFTVIETPTNVDPVLSIFASIFTGKPLLNTVEHFTISRSHHPRDFLVMLPMLDKLSKIRVLELADSLRKRDESLDLQTQKPTIITMNALKILRLCYGERMEYLRMPNLEALQIIDGTYPFFPTLPPKWAGLERTMLDLSITATAFEMLEGDCVEVVNNLHNVADPQGRSLRWEKLSKIHNVDIVERPLRDIHGILPLS